MTKRTKGPTERSRTSSIDRKPQRPRAPNGKSSSPAVSVEVAAVPAPSPEGEFRRQFGRRLIELRESQGVSQAALAERLGVERSRLGKWEQGHHIPPLPFVPTLAAALGVSADELLTGGAPAEGRGQVRVSLETGPALAIWLGNVCRLPQLAETLSDFRARLEVVFTPPPGLGLSQLPFRRELLQALSREEER